MIISPDYRLLPEVKGRDILDDLGAFWRWVHGGGPQRHLAAVAQSGVLMDMTRMLLLGESAGEPPFEIKVTCCMGPVCSLQLLTQVDTSPCSRLSWVSSDQGP